MNSFVAALSLIAVAVSCAGQPLASAFPVPLGGGGAAALHFLAPQPGVQAQLGGPPDPLAMMAAAGVPFPVAHGLPAPAQLGGGYGLRARNQQALHQSALYRQQAQQAAGESMLLQPSLVSLEPASPSGLSGANTETVEKIEQHIERQIEQSLEPASAHHDGGSDAGERHDEHGEHPSAGSSADEDGHSGAGAEKRDDQHHAHHEHHEHHHEHKEHQPRKYQQPEQENSHERHDHEHHEHHTPEAFEVHHKKGGKSFQYFHQGHHEHHHP